VIQTQTLQDKTDNLFLELVLNITLVCCKQ